MKRFILISALMLCVSSAFAQTHSSNEIVEGMKYKELKTIYNYKDWVSTDDDRYDPSWMGVCSFLIPGLGQMITGEVGRGFAWFGGAVGCYALIGTGAALETIGYYKSDGDATSGLAMTGSILTIAAYLGLAAVEVCAIIDAFRVAKVKNMYNQDLQKRNYSLNLYPSVDYIKMANGVQPTAGLTLAMRF